MEDKKDVLAITIDEYGDTSIGLTISWNDDACDDVELRAAFVSLLADVNDDDRLKRIMEEALACYAAMCADGNKPHTKVRYLS